MRSSSKQGTASSLPRLFAAAAALAGGCDSAGVTQQPPLLAASATTIDFGEQKVGTEAERTIYLINKGTIPLTLELPRGDLAGGVFAVLLEEYTATANKDVVARVKFMPADPITYTTEALIPNNSSNEPELRLVLYGDGVLPGPCDGVDCTATPAPACVTGTVSRHFQPLGVCVDGRCEHEYTDEPCQYGCDDTNGACRSDPCAGLACDTPPSPCYFAEGVCERGACIYTPNNAGNCTDSNPCTSGDHCEEGNCVGDPVACETPPAPVCVSTDTRRVWNTQGVCTSTSGGCEYMMQEQFCQFGCDPAGCIGDPCAGVVCNQPPAGQCFAQMGTCAGGSCTYATVPGPCDDGDPCTVNDTCNNGSCAGQPKTCTTPPAPDCPTSDTRRVYASSGTCVAGNCEYPPTVTSCNDNNACTSGDFCSSGACFSGGPTNCNDGNACTTDSCNPVSGCQHVPTSGNACVTGSGECPTGMCSAGTCLAVPNINCQAEYDLCFGLFHVDVPGLCSASGQCVVTQAPPQFICPGCNGLCLQCAPLGQICIPF